MRIVWLVFAQRDLVSIAEYYRQAADADISRHIISAIVHSASLLIDNPYLGRLSESTDGVHELHVPHLPYLLPYRVIDDRVEILRVFHESQDRPSAWQY
ncbi:type II toxin-antitoxin system RelE/ParE family toxin [Candidatus Kaiserbacteria bacterium]|nr:type II toxin-antitoxin system RelE/ParE family toxin [Candidatus Kaiserbacteria bacterium]